MSMMSGIGRRTAPLAASTTVSDTPDTLLMSTRAPSGVTATPLVYGGIGTVAATCASLARMIDS